MRRLAAALAAPNRLHSPAAFFRSLRRWPGNSVGTKAPSTLGRNPRYKLQFKSFPVQDTATVPDAGPVPGEQLARWADQQYRFLVPFPGLRPGLGERLGLRPENRRNQREDHRNDRNRFALRSGHRLATGVPLAISRQCRLDTGSKLPVAPARPRVAPFAG